MTQEKGRPEEPVREEETPSADPAPGQEKKPGFDREKYAEMKRAERAFVFSTIDAMLGKVSASSVPLMNTLQIMARFPTLSVNNALLLADQMPNARIIDDYKGWAEKGTRVRPGMKGAVLLDSPKPYERPDGSRGLLTRTKKVYDAAQTESMACVPPVPADLGRLLDSLLVNPPCAVVDDPGILAYDQPARYVPEERRIHADLKRYAGFLIPGLAGELAHAYMHREVYDYTGSRFTAACAEYIVCARFGIDLQYTVRRLQYLSGFPDRDPAAVRRGLEAARSAAAGIYMDASRYMTRERGGVSRDGEAHLVTVRESSQQERT